MGVVCTSGEDDVLVEPELEEWELCSAMFSEQSVSRGIDKFCSARMLVVGSGLMGERCVVATSSTARSSMGVGERMSAVLIASKTMFSFCRIVISRLGDMPKISAALSWRLASSTRVHFPSAIPGRGAKVVCRRFSRSINFGSFCISLDSLI